MKRLSRHTVVVLFVLMLSSIGGLSVAVVAFGQDSADPDATVPLGDYTSTTPASASTAPLSSYTTTTTSTAPLSSYTTTSTTKTTTSTPTQTNEATTTTGGTKTSPAAPSAPSSGGGGNFPSRATRSGPTHLAFTGGEPIVIGAFGVALMGAGVALHTRRRRRLG
jgi:cytoskeletal protein RodZ